MTRPAGCASVSIRPAVAEDYAGIVTVWSAAGLEVRQAGRDGKAAFLRQLAQFPDLYLVAVERKTIIGVVLGTHDHRKGWINRLAVVPKHRRRGVAEALARACDEAIRAHRIAIVSVLVDTDNVASCRLFEKLGYRTDVDVRYFRKLSHPDA